MYWTPCAAHCMDLMFEDIGKRGNVEAVVKAARMISKFIYNHGKLLSNVRDISTG